MDVGVDLLVIEYMYLSGIRDLFSRYFFSRHPFTFTFACAIFKTKIKPIEIYLRFETCTHIINKSMTAS
jgi:hypothetical protein